MGDIYRDPLAGLHAKRATARALEESVPSLLWSICPLEDRVEIARLLKRGFAEDSADANDSLDAVTSLLEQFVARARNQLVCAAEVEEPAGWLELGVVDALLLVPFRDAIRWALSSCVAAVPAEELDARGLVMRFQSTSAIPLLLTARLAMTVVKEFPARDVHGPFECSLRTTVPRGLPDLELTAERVWHAVQKTAGLAHELQLGDAPFDDAYWVRGDVDVARAVLVPRVREDLLVLSWRRPRLSLRSGSLEVLWHGQWDETRSHELMDGVRAAVASVDGIRGVIERARRG